MVDNPHLFRQWAALRWAHDYCRRFRKHVQFHERDLASLRFQVETLKRQVPILQQRINLMYEQIAIMNENLDFLYEQIGPRAPESRPETSTK
jgi:hypothetical protein